jgi:MoaA/NifB/PqqE/SkfB family radical SAM enzyme
VDGVIRAWGRILAGYRPSLSIEITRECPLRCPGCYAYNDEHLGGVVTLRDVRDFKGKALVDGVLALVDEHKPLHVSIVGGEPLVRYRELSEILPSLAARGIYTQLVTSAVRPIPLEWRGLKRLQLVVSIDGLQPEHDERRKPATYERILKHIAGHDMRVHCTVTSQQVRRVGYLDEFMRYWSANPNVKQIMVSLYTPQIGEESAERLSPADRASVVEQLYTLRERYPKMWMPKALISVYADPPKSPEKCVFAQTTECVSADFKTRITPCQFGGTPDCAECGCMASAGLGAVARHRIGGVMPVGPIFDVSLAIGRTMKGLRDSMSTPRPPRPAEHTPA